MVKVKRAKKKSKTKQGKGKARSVRGKAKVAKKKPKRVAKAPAGRGPAAKKKGRVGWNKLTIRQAAAVISGHLGEEGVEPVLTGSACAAVYAPSVKPKSLDFVVSEYRVEKVEEMMRLLGFSPRELRSFMCLEAPFEINFLPPPVAVGDEPVRRLRTLKSRRGAVRLLTPTDCVRQRLAAWYRWGDELAFGEALAVARRHPVNHHLIKRWSEWEWASDKYREFLSALKA